jgi:hypothetical protein
MAIQIELSRIYMGMLMDITETCQHIHKVLQMQVTASAFSSSPILVTLMMEATLSSESSVLTRATLHHLPENGILHSHPP